MAVREVEKSSGRRQGRSVSAGKHGRLREAVATIGLIAIFAGASVGAYTGFRWGGLGAAFIGALVGGGLGYALVYVITNVVRQNSRLFTLVLTLAVLGAIAWGLHWLGGSLGFNPK